MTPDLTNSSWDVAVIGGGAAGLSGAVLLGRALRSVVVIDTGAPRNAPSDGVHNYLTRDGVGPLDLVTAGRTEVALYGGVVLDATAVDAAADGAGFRVVLDDGRAVRARRLLVTTGLVDELPDVPGVRELWGIDVHHCPFCHGWEIRDQAVGVLGTPTMAYERALLYRQWTSDLVFFQHDAAPPTEDEAELLAARGIRVVPGRVDALVSNGGRLSGVRLADGTVVPRQGMFVAPRVAARSDVLRSLGVRPTEHPTGIGTFIVADPHGRTDVPGVFVAGNVADPMAQVVTAAAAGNLVASAITAELLAEDNAAALSDYRSRRSVA